MSLSSIIAPDCNSTKKRIITIFFYNRSMTIPELSKELNLSVPTVSKLVSELVEEEILTDYGKSESKTGRRPSTYGLNPQSGYFLGIDIKKDHLNLGISDFNGEIVRREFDIPYPWTGAAREELDRIIELVRDFVASSGIELPKILNACVNIGGRVNSYTGYSHSYFNFDETPLADVLSDALGMNVCVDNDSRSMAYGEYLCGSVRGEKDVLYVNLGWGLGLGIIISGAVYGGKSGYAGEFGHVYAFDNEILCHCGKKGCLETEVSGMALHRHVTEALSQGKVSCLSRLMEEQGSITLRNIVDAINAEDILCIEILEDIGRKLGRHLANLINIFNPELVVIGGTLAAVGDYLIQPVRQAVKKHSLRLVNSDSRIICSRLDERAGVIGACMTARRLMFERSY